MSLNTLDIYNVIMPYQKNGIFKGVFACDDLPQRVTLPAAFVINLSEKHTLGSHWVSLFIDIYGKAYYCDSYGMPPDNLHIKNFIRMHSKSMNYNKKQLQHMNSMKCGKYACIFVVQSLYCRKCLIYRLMNCWINFL